MLLAATRAEVIRLATLRSTAVYALLFVGSCAGPVVLMSLVYDPRYSGPIDAGDIGRCLSVLHMLAVVFAGATTVAEIRSGATTTAFLTQCSRWTSLVAHVLVRTAFLGVAYVVSTAAALLAARLCYPDGVVVGPRAWSYFAAYLVVVLVWALVAMVLAELTRSTAVAVATPLVWMLLAEPLMAMVPMLAALAHRMPFTAGLHLLAWVLDPSTPGGDPLPGALALTILCLGAVSAGLWSRCRRDAPR